MGLPAWDHSNLTALKHSHRFHFAPVNRSADEWATAIRASQFSTDCSKLLLVEDDMNNSGIGFTAKIWSFALLLAVRQGRVLLEVPRQAGVSRWCDRPPFSFQCLYEDWSHCQIPPPGTSEVVPGGRPLKMSKWPHLAPVVRTGLGRLHRQGMLWWSSGRSPIPSAEAFLFRPRPWVRAIGDCLMQESGLLPGKFLSIHIRHSKEKADEGKKLHVQLPVFKAYHVLTDALVLDTGIRHVFLQTASPAALTDFTQYALTRNLSISYTDNPRSENDAWGGWQHGSEMEQATIGAVNAYVGSLAAIVVSPEISIWTDFLWKTLRTTSSTSHGGRQIAPLFAVRCRPSLQAASAFSVFGPLANVSELPSVDRECAVRARIHKKSG